MPCWLFNWHLKSAAVFYIENLREDTLQMSNRRSKKKLEEKIARQVAFRNSEVSPDKDKIREVIFVGTADQLKGDVLAIICDQREGDIPEIPQGCVLANPIGEGLYDVELP